MSCSDEEVISSFNDEQVDQFYDAAAAAAASLVKHMPIREQIRIAADLLDGISARPELPGRPPFRVAMAKNIMLTIDEYLEKNPKALRGRIDLSLR